MEEKHGENTQKDACALEELGKLSNTVTSSKEKPKKHTRTSPPKVCRYCHRIIQPNEPKVSKRLWVSEDKGHRYRPLSYQESKRQHGRVRGMRRAYAHTKCFEEFAFIDSADSEENEE